MYENLLFLGHGNTMQASEAFVQQPFQEAAKYLVKSHFSFASFFILAESTLIGSSQLLEAAER
jgi:hypothetical protein